MTTFDAWLAGFWEGDGCLHRNNGLRITQKSYLPLFRIYQVYGGYIRLEKMAGGRYYYRWSLTDYPTICTVLLAMQPHLRFRYAEVERYLNAPPKRSWHRTKAL